MEKNIPAVGQDKCQVHQLEQSIRRGENAETILLPLRHRLRLVLRRNFTPSTKRKVKGLLDRLANLPSRLTRKAEPSSTALTDPPSTQFSPGDKVLVKSKDQVQTTLNSWNELKGCSFLREMWQYCGTKQIVLKPVKRFVDERDCRVKKVNGVYLLVGVNCQGFELYGECDRACFYFWREEWLEKATD